MFLSCNFKKGIGFECSHQACSGLLSLSLSPKRKSYVAPFRQLRETNTSTEVGVVDLVTLRVHHRWMINAPWTIIFHAFLFFTSSSSIKVNLCTKCKIYFSVNYGIVFNLKTIQILLRSQLKVVIAKTFLQQKLMIIIVSLKQLFICISWEYL